MTTKHEKLRMFQAAYLDYLEGDRDEPPTLDNLEGKERLMAEAFIETLRAVRGIDPYASRPSIEQLLESQSKKTDTPRNLQSTLQNHLRETVDADAVVTVDAALGTTEMESSLVIQARGIRIRVVEEGSGNLDKALTHKADIIGRVFSTFPDCQAVLYTTGGPDPRGVVLARGDVYGAIETPSGEECPPRLPRAVVAAEMACEIWLKGLIPDFRPLGRELLESAKTAQSSIDAFELASKVVKEVSASGARARIEAKREAWGRFGGREARQLAALVEDARSGRLTEENYESHINELGRMAA